jgi:hypothetical protein
MREYVGGGTSYVVKVNCSDKEYQEVYDSNGLRIRISFRPCGSESKNI